VYTVHKVPNQNIPQTRRAVVFDSALFLCLN
jgi:hypothetical protein